VSLALFLIGLIIILFSFAESYPIVVRSVDDTPFEQFYPLFWLGLPITLVSLFMISFSFQRKEVMFFCSVLFVFFFWVHYLFFPLLPGSDSHYFRGATEDFMGVGVNPSEKDYFQWPAFFILNNVLSEISKINVDVACVIVFVAVGFLLSSSLFIFFSREDKMLGFVGVVLYFVGAYTFIDYQFAPQSFALGLFFLLLILMERKGIPSKVALIIIFTSLVYAHAFIPVFFLFLIFLFALKQPRYRNLFFLCLVIYFSVLVFFQISHFYALPSAFGNVIYIWRGEYGRILTATITEPKSLLDNISQTVSRIMTVSIWLVLSIGFIAQIIGKKVKFKELALAIAGFSYFGLGTFFPTLGSRAIQILFVSATTGYNWIQRNFRKAAYLFILIIIILSPLVLVHRMYGVGFFQTTSGERATNFLASTLLTKSSQANMVATREDNGYLLGRLPQNILLKADDALPFGATKDEIQAFQEKVNHPNENYNYILYNVLLEKELLQSGAFSKEDISGFHQKCLSNFNLIYDDGYIVIFYMEQPQ
jgi:hypothetical protein